MCKSQITEATDALARQIRRLAEFEISERPAQVDELRGAEGLGAATYFGVFAAPAQAAA